MGTLSCTIFFFKQPPFSPLLFSPLLSRSKEKRGGMPKRYSVSTGCSCCDWSSPQAEVLWFLFHLIHHSELSRGLCLILDLKQLGWYLPHPLSSKGLRIESIYFIVLAAFSRELPNSDKLEGANNISVSDLALKDVFLLRHSLIILFHVAWALCPGSLQN